MRCGENVGKEDRKTLVECILRGFPVSLAGGGMSLPHSGSLIMKQLEFSF